MKKKEKKIDKKKRRVYIRGNICYYTIQLSTYYVGFDYTLRLYTSYV